MTKKKYKGLQLGTIEEEKEDDEVEEIPPPVSRRDRVPPTAAERERRETQHAVARSMMAIKQEPIEDTSVMNPAPVNVPDPETRQKNSSRAAVTETLVSSIKREHRENSLRAKLLDPNLSPRGRRGFLRELNKMKNTASEEVEANHPVPDGVEENPAPEGVEENVGEKMVEDPAALEGRADNPEEIEDTSGGIEDNADPERMEDNPAPERFPRALIKAEPILRGKQWEADRIVKELNEGERICYEIVQQFENRMTRSRAAAFPSSASRTETKPIGMKPAKPVAKIPSSSSQQNADAGDEGPQPADSVKTRSRIKKEHHEPSVCLPQSSAQVQPNQPVHPVVESKPIINRAQNRLNNVPTCSDPRRNQQFSISAPPREKSVKTSPVRPARVIEEIEVANIQSTFRAVPASSAPTSNRSLRWNDVIGPPAIAAVPPNMPAGRLPRPARRQDSSEVIPPPLPPTREIRIARQREDSPIAPGPLHLVLPAPAVPEPAVPQAVIKREPTVREFVTELIKGKALVKSKSANSEQSLNGESSSGHDPEPIKEADSQMLSGPLPADEPVAVRYEEVILLDDVVPEADEPVSVQNSPEIIITIEENQEVEEMKSPEPSRAPTPDGSVEMREELGRQEAVELDHLQEEEDDIEFIGFVEVGMEDDADSVIEEILDTSPFCVTPARSEDLESDEDELEEVHMENAQSVLPAVPSQQNYRSLSPEDIIMAEPQEVLNAVTPYAQPVLPVDPLNQNSPRISEAITISEPQDGDIATCAQKSFADGNKETKDAPASLPAVPPIQNGPIIPEAITISEPQEVHDAVTPDAQPVFPVVPSNQNAPMIPEAIAISEPQECDIAPCAQKSVADDNEGAEDAPASLPAVPPIQNDPSIPEAITISESQDVRNAASSNTQPVLPDPLPKQSDLPIVPKAFGTTEPQDGNNAPCAPNSIAIGKEETEDASVSLSVVHPQANISADDVPMEVEKLDLQEAGVPMREESLEISNTQSPAPAPVDDDSCLPVADAEPISKLGSDVSNSEAKAKKSGEVIPEEQMLVQIDSDSSEENSATDRGASSALSILSVTDTDSTQVSPSNPVTPAEEIQEISKVKSIDQQNIEKVAALLENGKKQMQDSGTKDSEAKGSKHVEDDDVPKDVESTLPTEDSPQIAQKTEEENSDHHKAESNSASPGQPSPVPISQEISNESNEKCRGIVDEGLEHTEKESDNISSQHDVPAQISDLLETVKRKELSAGSGAVVLLPSNYVHMEFSYPSHPEIGNAENTDVMLEEGYPNDARQNLLMTLDVHAACEELMPVQNESPDEPLKDDDVPKDDQPATSADKVAQAETVAPENDEENSIAPESGTNNSTPIEQSPVPMEIEADDDWDAEDCETPEAAVQVSPPVNVQEEVVQLKEHLTHSTDPKNMDEAVAFSNGGDQMENSGPKDSQAEGSDHDEDAREKVMPVQEESAHETLREDVPKDDQPATSVDKVVQTETVASDGKAENSINRETETNTTSLVQPCPVPMDIDANDDLNAEDVNQAAAPVDVQEGVVQQEVHLAQSTDPKNIEGAAVVLPRNDDQMEDSGPNDVQAEDSDHAEDAREELVPVQEGSPDETLQEDVPKDDHPAQAETVASKDEEETPIPLEESNSTIEPIPVPMNIEADEDSDAEGGERPEAVIQVAPSVNGQEGIAQLEEHLAQPLVPKNMNEAAAASSNDSDHDGDAHEELMPLQEESPDEPLQDNDVLKDAEPTLLAEESLQTAQETTAAEGDQIEEKHPVAPDAETDTTSPVQPIPVQIEENCHEIVNEELEHTEKKSADSSSAHDVNSQIANVPDEPESCLIELQEKSTSNEINTLRLEKDIHLEDENSDRQEAKLNEHQPVEQAILQVPDVAQVAQFEESNDQDAFGQSQEQLNINDNSDEPDDIFQLSTEDLDAYLKHFETDDKDSAVSDQTEGLESSQPVQCKPAAQNGNQAEETNQESASSVNAEEGHKVVGNQNHTASEPLKNAQAVVREDAREEDEHPEEPKTNGVTKPIRQAESNLSRQEARRQLLERYFGDMSDSLGEEDNGDRPGQQVNEVVGHREESQTELAATTQQEPSDSSNQRKREPSGYESNEHEAGSDPRVNSVPVQVQATSSSHPRNDHTTTVARSEAEHYRRLKELLDTGFKGRFDSQPEESDEEAVGEADDEQNTEDGALSDEVEDFEQDHHPYQSIYNSPQNFDFQDGEDRIRKRQESVHDDPESPPAKCRKTERCCSIESYGNFERNDEKGANRMSQSGGGSLPMSHDRDIYTPPRNDHQEVEMEDSNEPETPARIMARMLSDPTIRSGPLIGPPPPALRYNAPPPRKASKKQSYEDDYDSSQDAEPEVESAESEGEGFDGGNNGKKKIPKKRNSKSASQKKPAGSHKKKIEKPAPKKKQPSSRRNGETSNMSSSTGKRAAAHVGRNTNNSRSSFPTPLHNHPDRPVTMPTRRVLIDSDEEMASTADPLEPAKRPRTPRPRYSPDTPRRHTPRMAMSALSIETSRNTDLNADGTAPSSSGSTQQMSGDSDRRETRRRDDSSRRKTQTSAPPPDDPPPKSHKRAGNSAGRHRKRRSPSPQCSQDESFMDETDGCAEWKNMPIVVDDPSYKITPEHSFLFRTIKVRVRDSIEIHKTEMADLYRKGEDIRLPRSIHFGKFVMQSWFGSPFPLEYARLQCLHICEFCLYYARSDPVMQNHSAKCWVRAPPGVEIYRKESTSVFEVDGRIERDYCQNVCLIARLFLESKTLFYDTDPFLFYIVTVNDEMGSHFAGYFSKEKYEPDKNNLSCIMTLPCYQEKGFGRFLIEVSYNLSKREGWYGGPEQPLSDLGRAAYGSYWRTAIYEALLDRKWDIEEGEGLSIQDISEMTGINQHDILEFLEYMGWVDAEDDGTVIWDVDWSLCKMHLEERKKLRKTAFDVRCFDWQPRKITPKMDSFVELTQQEVEADEEKMRKKSCQQTPMSSASLLKSTPASSTSHQTGGSIKKTLRSRGTRTVGRNLKLEVSKKVTVPEWAGARDVTDDETEERKKRERGRKRKEKRKLGGSARCQEPPVEKTKREESPDDDGGPSTSSSFKHPTRRSRRVLDDSSDATTSSRKPTAPPPGKGGRGGGKNRHNKKSAGKMIFGDDSEEDVTSSESSDDDDVPFGAQKGKKGGRHAEKGKKRQRNHKPGGFPLDYAKKKVEEGEKEVKQEERQEETEIQKQMRADDVRTEELEKKTEEQKRWEDEEEDIVDNNDDEEELGRDYIIGTPESYHSTPPASPAPALALAHQMVDEVEDQVQEPQIPQIFAQQSGDHDAQQHLLDSQHHQQFEENDAAPPLLVSEVGNLTVADSENHAAEVQPTLAPNLADGDGYSTGDDDAPPRLSPQYDKNEEVEEAPLQTETPAPAPVRNGLSEYREMHLTPQMMPSTSQSQNHNSNQNMMTSTPQHPYSHQGSHQGPNSHQQTTPGSGGVPSCGPVYNHSTPEQQAAQQQQFMSPMAGMPASVSSVHSVHNSASMEMVGGPASLQHTPQQQQQYDMGHGMGQMPQDNNVNAAVIEQQNQHMMAHRGFNSPPGGQNNVVLPPPQQPPQPVQVAPLPAVPAPTNGRRRSDTAAQRKRNQTARAAAAAAAAVPQMPNPNQMIPMHQQMMMNGYYQNFMPGMAAAYPPYQHMWEAYNYQYYQQMEAMNYPRNPWAQYPPVQQQAQVPQNGHMPADGAGLPAAALQQFPPYTAAAANQWHFNQQNNMR